FVARQLELWPIDLDPSLLQWKEDSVQLLACTHCHKRHEAMPVEVEPGVREMITAGADGDLPWENCGLGLGRSAGWTRPAAEEWVRQRFSKSSRTVSVE